MDSLVLGLSEAYSKLRKIQSPVAGEETLWEPPDMFQRNTTKYWIHPADVLRVKCLVMKHLPILIFGETSAVVRHTPLKQQSQRDHGLISSVYLDTNKLDIYHERLVREHGSSLVRVRWYGKELGDKVFVERKVHKDGWTGEDSYKERADLSVTEVMRFLQGHSTAAKGGSHSKTALLKDIQDRIRQRQEVPSIRTEYCRTAFQESSSNNVRMSLDTNLRIIKEFNAPKNADEWCRSLSSEIEETDVVHFPYAIFEIKIRGDSSPDWIQDLIETDLLVEVPKFSKFLHGTAMLFGSKLRHSPSWFVPDNKGHMTPATFNELAEKTDSCTKNAPGRLFPFAIIGQDASQRYKVDASIQNTEKSSRRCRFPWRKENPPYTSLSENRAAALVRTRIEPKTFFANERTFLSWLSVAVMVMFIGLSLLDNTIAAGSSLKHFPSNSQCLDSSSVPIHIADSVANSTAVIDRSRTTHSGMKCNAARISGALIAPVAIVLMIYALYMYRKRSIQILRRETLRYDDPYGPIVLTVLLVTVLSLAFVLSIL